MNHVLSAIGNWVGSASLTTVDEDDMQAVPARPATQIGTRHAHATEAEAEAEA